MARFNRYGRLSRSSLTQHESRRTLTQSRAEARRQRDMYMMFTAALALANDGVLTITEAMASKITPTLQLTVTRTAEGVIEVRAEDPMTIAPDTVETSPAPPELEIRAIEEPSDAAV